MAERKLIAALSLQKLGNTEARSNLKMDIKTLNNLNRAIAARDKGAKVGRKRGRNDNGNNAASGSQRRRLNAASGQALP